ncbi:MAG: glycosyltransferase involved in cell wall biosynthesis [Candidatus Latescibacterota bacterium]|jgi:glycosyltransferase involved in cell wall biosynthesis
MPPHHTATETRVGTKGLAPMPKSQTNQTVDVSIIIPTYNRSQSLERTLRSIAKNEYTRTYDVTVIDDGSPDDTCEMLEHLQKEMPYRLNYHTQENSGPAVARNLGISSTTGPYVVFLDDDHEVLDGWLDALCDPLVDSTIGVANGKNDSVPDGGLSARYVCMRDEREAEKVATDKERYLTSGNAAIRRETLEATGGFDPSYKAVFKGVAPGGEDTELGMRIRESGLQIVYRPKALTNHFREMKLSKFFKERFNFGRNRVQWLVAENRPMSLGSALRNALRAIISTLAIPLHTLTFRKMGYSWSDSFAFGTLEKFAQIVYEYGTLYGLVTK